MSEQNPEKPAVPALKPPVKKTPVKEPRLVYEVEPIPPGYKHTGLWMAIVLLFCIALLLGITGVLIASGAADALFQLLGSILSP
jgi:hypothetical protein